MEKRIKESFKIWNKNIQQEGITDKNNKSALILFDFEKEGKGFKYKIDHRSYLNQLKFGLEDKIEVYFNKDKELLGKVRFDKINGGANGLVHGGCLFFVLYLCINILFDKWFPIDSQEYSFKILAHFINKKYQ